MNIFIVALVIMALSQTVMSAEGGTLAKAIEVAQQIRADADEAYAKGVARRNERHQWHDATTAVKRIKTRYDLLKLIQSNAQTYYDRHKSNYGGCWVIGPCFEDQMAAVYWKGLMDATYPNIETAEAWINPEGITMVAELSRAKQHLEWAKGEKARALVISGFVKGSFKVDEYKQLATLTVNSASEDVLKAEPVVARARNRVNSVSDKALEKVRQVKYKEADDYLNAQKAIYDAEQAAIDKVKQAIHDAEQAAISEAEQDAIEMENIWFMLVLQSLYAAE